MESKPTVFVIDDDDGVRRSLGLTLRAASLEVMTFASGEEFLAAISGEAAGCLVLDLRLKGMSGLELLREMRLRGIKMPAIMLSGHGEGPAAETAKVLGAVDFISKPVDPKTLVKKVRAVLAQGGGD